MIDEGPRRPATTSEFFTSGVAQRDPMIAEALASEGRRQQQQIELIASENIVSRAVLEALGHEVANKTLEGYPGARYHAGGRFVDVIEQAAVDRACELFGCAYANVQPHSGSQANLAVFFALVRPGDRVLSLDLAAGGHLSHGLRANLSGRWFEAHHYGVSRETGMIDYGEAEARILEVRPRLLIAGGSSYPRTLDFERLADAARTVGAYFVVDMAHIAGLVAGGAHPSPIPHADIVTCTTTKTLRGPRGGMILARDESWRRKLQSAVFPGVQGSIHTQVIAAKAVCLGEALQPEFRVYAHQVKKNAARLGRGPGRGRTGGRYRRHGHPHRPAGPIRDQNDRSGCRARSRAVRHHDQQESDPVRRQQSGRVERAADRSRGRHHPRVPGGGNGTARTGDFLPADVTRCRRRGATDRGEALPIVPARHADA